MKSYLYFLSLYFATLLHYSAIEEQISRTAHFILGMFSSFSNSELPKLLEKDERLHQALDLSVPCIALGSRPIRAGKAAKRPIVA